jgi:hypothetical protein
MPRLGDVVGALLRDIADAQDCSNRYSTALADEYRHDRLLREFAVPNALVAEVDLELRYAVLQVAGASTRVERDMVAARKAFTDWSAAVAPAVAACLGGTADPVAIAAALAEGLYESREAILGRGNVLIAERAVEAGRAALLKALAATPSTPSQDALRALLESEVPRLADRVRAPEGPRPDFDVDVIVDAAALAELPAGAIASLRVKAMPRSHRWVAFEGEEQRLVRET